MCKYKWRGLEEKQALFLLNTSGNIYKACTKQNKYQNNTGQSLILYIMAKIVYIEHFSKHAVFLPDEFDNVHFFTVCLYSENH